MRLLETKSFAVSLAVLIGAAIIAASILATALIAPYRISGGADGTWRINAITGETQMCSIAFGGCRSPKF